MNWNWILSCEVYTCRISTIYNFSSLLTNKWWKCSKPNINFWFIINTWLFYNLLSFYLINHPIALILVFILIWIKIEIILSFIFRKWIKLCCLYCLIIIEISLNIIWYLFRYIINIRISMKSSNSTIIIDKTFTNRCNFSRQLSCFC